MQTAFEFLKDLPPRPKHPERLFFGLLLNKGTGILIDECRRKLFDANHIGGKFLKTERLHISLCHVGDYKRLRPKFIYAARCAADAICMRPFEVTFRVITSFEPAARANDIPVVLLGEGSALWELHKVLGAAMKRNGLKAMEHFTPHMTLSYGRTSIAPRAIEPISFVADEFVLIHSKKWLGEYELIDRWPLRG